MNNIFQPGDLAIVTANTTDNNFEFPHIMKGDIVEIASLRTREVIRDRSPYAPRVTSDCDVEAPDGTVWPAAFSSLRKIIDGDNDSGAACHWDWVEAAIGFTPDGLKSES